MNIENTQSQMKKGILEFCILSIIRRGEAYPSDIVEEMRAANLPSWKAPCTRCLPG
jgi:PadR family transcriptional regulator PadR